MAKISLLVTGNLIGAGILALPIQTGGVGFFYSLLAMVAFCAAMYFSAVVLAKLAIDRRDENFNYPSLYGEYLGFWGKWIATFANLLILYGLLTAYMGGGTTIITSLLPFEKSVFLTISVTLLLFLGLSVFTAAGVGFVSKYNQLLMLFLAISFFALVFIGVGEIKLKRLLFHDARFLPIAVPVILTSFHFHNIIPSICKDMDWDLSAVSKAMLIGMIIGFAVNAVWIGVGLGVLPLTIGPYSIVNAFSNGLPATVPLSKIIQNHLFNPIAAVFALTAIFTSFSANGIGLSDFNKDLFRGKSKFLILGMTFLPPLVIVLLFPTIFLKAVGVVGGVGIALLFGILPSVIFFIKNKKPALRILAVAIGLVFTIAMAIDLCNDFGIISTDKAIEHIKILSAQEFNK